MKFFLEDLSDNYPFMVKFSRMAVGEEGDRVSTIMYTDYGALIGGRRTSVDVLEEENLVILVSDCSFDFSLYYSIGEIKGRTIRFGQSHKFITGTCPRAWY